MICGQKTSERCGGHVHIGSDYLTSSESWSVLSDLWINNEEIFYIISNKEGEIPRKSVIEYAKPISTELSEKMQQSGIQLDSIEDIKKVAKDSQKSRYYGINFYNIGNSKNTIEFRLANGTIDADTWIQNINLFGGLIKASEDIGLIYQKDEEKRTEDEKKKIELFESLNKDGLSEEERLDVLLSIVVDEEKREIYKNRYKTNNELLKQDNELRTNIYTQTAPKHISISKLCKKVLSGEDRINGIEYEMISDEIVHGIAEQQKTQNKEDFYYE